MSWKDQIDSLNSRALSSFGESSSGYGPVTIQRDIMEVEIEAIFTIRGIQPDEQIPETLQLFVSVADVMASAIGDVPQRGDSVIVRGQEYDIFNVAFDTAGGAHLTIKKA